MSDVLLSVENLAKRFGGIVATDNLSLSVTQGELHSVIGPNGAGKTTLISQLSGMLMPDQGIVRFDGVDITRTSAPERSQMGLARSFQITSILKDFTVLENVSIAVQAHSGHSFKFWGAAHKEKALIEPAEQVLEKIGLLDRANVTAANLAHGEQRQLELAMVMATKPKLLLLDEPTAGMGPEESTAMAKMLRELKGQYTILLIEHDMDTVFALSDRISVLVYGKTIATGTPDEIRNNADVKRAYLGEEGASC